MIGSTLGNYRIVEKIGMGGMATVYKAFDPTTDRYVAVKVLPDRYSDDPKFLARFEREAKAIAGLEHMNILPVHAYGEQDGTSYLVMRYLETGTLSDLLRQGSPPLGETARLFGQIAGALDYAHQKGVIHRDVKPSNVLLDSQNNAYLTDFGIARMIEGSSDLTGTGMALGTPQYMSPEQCRGQKDLTAATDIYSLGVMLYQMVTGRLPFEAETPLATIQMHLFDPLPPPRTVRADLPESVERVILKAMAKQPELRFESAAMLGQVLTDAVAGAAPIPVDDGLAETIAIPDPTAPTTDVHASPPSLAAPRPRRRWPLFAGLAAVMVSVLGAGLIFGLPLLSSQPDVTEEQEEEQAQVIEGGESGAEPTTEAVVRGEPLILKGHTEGVTSLAWSPDGTQLASASQDNTIMVWDSASGDQIGSLGGGLEDVTSVDWSPDGTVLASGSSDTTVTLWDAATGEALQTLAGHGGDVSDVAWSPDGTLLASSSHDETAIIWNSAGEQLFLLQHDDVISTLVWSPDSSRLGTGGHDRLIRLWNTEFGTRHLLWEAYPFLAARLVTVHDVAWSPDGALIASAGTNNTITLWDAETGDLQQELEGHQDWVITLAWSPDGSRLASGSDDDTVIVWDLSSGSPAITLEGHVDNVQDVAWSPDGGMLASGSNDGTVRLWDVRDIP
jgi:serine/threonine protein kinase